MLYKPRVAGICGLEPSRGTSAFEVDVYAPHGASAGVRALFMEWAFVRITRLVEAGPEPDGWGPAAGGAWCLWARLHDFGSDITEL